MVTIAFNYNCTCYRPPLIAITLTMTILTICYHMVKQQRTIAAGGRYSSLWYKNTTSVRSISKFLPLMYTQIYVYAYMCINNHVVLCNHACRRVARSMQESFRWYEEGATTASWANMDDKWRQIRIFLP